MQTGIVNKLWTKSVNTRRGPADVHLCALAGDDSVYNLQFKKPTIKEGDEISFVVSEEMYGEKQVDLGTIKILSRDNKVDKAAPTPSVPKNTGGSGGRGMFPIPVTDGQRSIIRQHAFTQASEIYREYFRNGDGEFLHDAHAYPDEVVEKVIGLAYQIEHYTSGDDVRELAEKDDV